MLKNNIIFFSYQTVFRTLTLQKERINRIIIIILILLRVNNWILVIRHIHLLNICQLPNWRANVAKGRVWPGSAKLDTKLV